MYMLYLIHKKFSLVPHTHHGSQQTCMPPAVNMAISIVGST